MSYKDKYKRYSLINADDIRSVRIFDTKLFISSGFKDSPSFFQVLLNNDPLPLNSQIVDDSDVKDQKKIIVIDRAIKNGDVITWNSEKWMNILTDDMSGIYYRGTLRLCSGQLKWLNEDGELNSRYFAFKSDPATNFGTDNGNIIVLGSERRTLLVSFDEDTTGFRKDNRFIFDGRAWKITALDNISLKGIAIVTVQEDLINTATDNLELEIADYYGSVADYDIKINNGSFVTIASDQSLQLNVVVTNNTFPILSPTLSYASRNETIAVVSSGGIITPISSGSVDIVVTYRNVSAQIEVSITDSTAFSYTCEIIGPSEIKVGRTQSYTTKFYRNGIEYPDKSRFSLTLDGDGSPTNLAKITEQDIDLNTCSIVAGNEIGYIYLHVKNDNGLSESKIRLRIKPLY